jgi:hypothetical protein
MKWTIRLILAGIALLILLLLGAMIAAWQYMERPSTIEKIRSAASQGVGGDVQFVDLDLKPFRGLEIEGIRIYPEPTALPGEDFLTMRRLQLDYRPWRLIQRTIEFKRIYVDTPRLTLRQNPDASWRYPRINAGALAEQLTFQTGLLRFSILLNDFDLKDGALQLIADNGDNIYLAEGIGITGNLALAPGLGQANGQISIRDMRWGSLLTAQRLISPIRLKDDLILLPEITADMHGGRLRGTAQIDLGLGGPNFDSDLQLNGVSLAALLEDFRANSGLLGGQLDARAKFSGSLQDPTLVQGNGELEIQDARISILSNITPLGRLLNIPELNSHTFPLLRGTFKISEERITFYNLEASSERVQITAAGHAGLDRTIDFDVSLALHPEIAAKIPEKNRNRLTTRPDGFHVITFKLDGNMDEPRTNLLEKLGFVREP